MPGHVGLPHHPVSAVAAAVLSGADSVDVFDATAIVISTDTPDRLIGLSLPVLVLEVFWVSLRGLVAVWALRNRTCRLHQLFMGLEGKTSKETGSRYGGGCEQVCT